MPETQEISEVPGHVSSVWMMIFFPLQNQAQMTTIQSEMMLDD